MVALVSATFFLEHPQSQKAKKGQKLGKGTARPIQTLKTQTQATKVTERP